MTRETRAHHRRRRDRRGRGLRGPIAPPGVPIRRSRAQLFDDLVLDAVERLETRWESRLQGVEFAVEDVPATHLADHSGLDHDDPIPLGQLVPRTGTDPARIVVYRRPIESRASGQRALGDLVHEVVVERVAELLGIDPSAIDPEYEDPDG